MVAPIVVAVAGVFGAILRLAEHPIMAWILIESALMIDSSVASFIGYQGATGMLISWVLSSFGVNIVIASWHLLVLFGIFPLFIFALKHSG